MWIARDLEASLTKGTALPARIVVGVRQCGKTSLLSHCAPAEWRQVNLDDLQLRALANRDPALFFELHPPPAVIDEIQHAPPLFAEIKRRIDSWRADRRESKDGSVTAAPQVWASGSNQILLDRTVKESLAGRASYYTLHTLSVAELARAFGDFRLESAFARGGWPELYVTPSLDPVAYLNDYVRSYVERDVVLSAGIQKADAFTLTLGMIAARTGGLLNASSISQESGVQVSTVLEWVGVLERTHVLFRLPPYHSNINKRLTKTPKVYVLDTALAARLQGWSDPGPLLRSPQAGPLFETLALGEIVRTRDHFMKDWQLSFWRTKEGDEVDFLVRNGTGRTVALDAKLGIQSIRPAVLPASLRGELPEVTELVVVSSGGEERRLSPQCRQVPIARLSEFLLSRL